MEGKKERRCAAASCSAVGTYGWCASIRDVSTVGIARRRTFAHEPCFDIPGHLGAIFGKDLVCEHECIWH